MMSAKPDNTQLSPKRGEFIKNGYSVEIGAHGSFVVFHGGFRENVGGDGVRRQICGFTDYQDLLSWLAEEHKNLAKASRPSDD